MREQSKDKVRLEHIVQAIERIKRYMSEKCFDDFNTDDMMYYAVLCQSIREFSIPKTIDQCIVCIEMCV